MPTGNLNQYTKSFSFPYLHGVYLAVNAVSDIFLLVDAPSCNFFRAEDIFVSHDMNSTLLSTAGRHRINVTRIHVDNVAAGDNQTFSTALQRMLKVDFINLLVVALNPMATIIGTPHDSLLAATEVPAGKQVVLLPGTSLDADWLDGYAGFMHLLAEELPLPDVQPDPRRVAVVGYLMERNEEDHHGNLREVKRLLESLSLEVCSIWFDGSTVESLQRVAEAGTILSFPHGKAAARKLAERTGAQLLECQIPFGLEATDRWLRQVGEFFGLRDEARRAIEENLELVIPRLKWVVLEKLLHRRFSFAGDPYLIPGFAEFARLLGLQLDHVFPFCTNMPELSIPAQPDFTMHASCTVKEISDMLESLHETTDFLVGNSVLRDDCVVKPVSFVEMGFPSRGYHAVFDSPYLGYRGALCLVNRLLGGLDNAGSIMN